MYAFTAAHKTLPLRTYVRVTNLENGRSVIVRVNGEIVSRTELTEHIYAQDYDRDSNTIEVFVGRLRKKLPPDTIETVRGLGYRLAAPQ